MAAVGPEAVQDKTGTLVVVAVLQVIVVPPDGPEGVQLATGTSVVVTVGQVVVTQLFAAVPGLAVQVAETTWFWPGVQMV